MQRLFILLTSLLALGAGATVLTGCDSADPEADGQSRVRILLTDAPVDDIVEAHVLIERVELLGEDERVILLADEPQPFDLLTLQDGVTVLLADLDVPDGTYHQVRIVVDETAMVVFDDGTEEPLKVPSGTQTGIKINLPDLVIDEDVVEVTIDFDLQASFVKRGNSGKGYIFKPVLKPLVVEINGDDIDLDDFVEE